MTEGPSTQLHSDYGSIGRAKKSASAPTDLASYASRSQPLTWFAGTWRMDAVARILRFPAEPSMGAGP